MDTMRPLDEALRLAMHRRQHHQQDAADAIGCSRGTIGHWLHNAGSSRPRVSREQLAALEDYCELTWPEVLYAVGLLTAERAEAARDEIRRGRLPA